MFRILVVDDEPSTAHLLREVTKYLQHEHELYFAQDGVEALDFLFGHGGHGKGSMLPDLILLDMNMPRMDGLQTLSAIKADSELCLIPVIMLSSAASPEIVRKSYQAHANCYVVKPSDLGRTQRLVEAIEAFWMNFSQRPWTTLMPEESSMISKEKGFDPQPKAVTTRAVPDRDPGKPEDRGCDEHNRLLDEFGEAVRQVLQVHEEQFLAIVSGDTESNRFDLLIHLANERKQRAKYDYMRHVEAHGCTGQRMPLSKLEREVITDSMLKVQSIQASLEQIDDRKIPAAEDIHDCLDAADHSFRDALKDEPPTEKKEQQKPNSDTKAKG